MGGIQDKGYTPISQAEIETILDKLQELLNAHENCLTDNGVKMAEFFYTSFGDLKDYVLKGIYRGGFGILVYAWYPYEC